MCRLLVFLPSTKKKLFKYSGNLSVNMFAIFVQEKYVNNTINNTFIGYNIEKKKTNFKC